MTTTTTTTTTTATATAETATTLVHRVVTGQRTVEVCEGVFLTKEVTNKAVFGGKEAVLYPRYNSWAGFNGWIKTVMEGLNLTEVEAYIALLNPEEDFGWVLGLRESTKLRIMEFVTPFNHTTIVKEAIQKWEKNSSICNLEDLLKYGCSYVLLWACPKNRFEFSRARRMVEVSYEKNQNLKMFQSIKGWTRTDKELSVFAYLGKFSPKLITLAEVLGNMKVVNMVYKLFPEMDVAYIKDATVGSFMSAGCSLKKLVPEATSKEFKSFMSTYSKKERITDLKEDFRIFLIKKSEIPSDWRREIGSVQVARWAERHINQLSKSRVIHGPAGEAQTLHYHALLREVTPAMVPSIKTSWKRVMAGVEEVAQQRLMADLGNNTPLPTLKHPAVKGVTPIDTSFKLRDEGEKMAHCVGGYVHSCLAGKSYIYHCGEPAPGGSTLEVCRKEGKYVGIQQYTYKDKSPTSNDVRLKASLVSILNKERR